MTSGVSKRGLFPAWLVAFYATWLTLVVSRDLFDVVRDHWPIALSMLFGSYFAGSTPMGGGTVGFPVLVLLFDQPASLGRNFSLAVQSIGMTSASIYIISASRPVAWRLLRYSLLGALVATPLGAIFLAPHAPAKSVTLLFAVIWCSFGMMHLMRMRDVLRPATPGALPPNLDVTAGLFIGLSGGVAASLTGVGIDMILYTVMVTLYRADIRVAIPTSVLLMASTSLIGLVTNLALGTMNAEVFGNWLAAAPIVALGAPFGAVVVEMISRAKTLWVVAVLCVGQYVWAVLHDQVTGWPLVLSLVAVLALNVLFAWMYRIGERWASTRSGGPPTDVHISGGTR